MKISLMLTLLIFAGFSPTTSQLLKQVILILLSLIIYIITAFLFIALPFVAKKFLIIYPCSAIINRIIYCFAIFIFLSKTT